MQIDSKGKCHWTKAKRPLAFTIFWLFLSLLVGVGLTCAQDEEGEDLNVFWKWNVDHPARRESDASDRSSSMCRLISLISGSNFGPWPVIAES